MTALLKLTFVFGGIILLLSRKCDLGLALLLASAAVGLLFDHPPLEIARDALLASVDPLTLLLAGAVVLIILLGELLRQTGSIKGLVDALQALIPSQRIVIAALPALIGLLPMVGGAMFSAPMVEEIGAQWQGKGNGCSLSSERKTFINYWFRHFWEPISPLYPSMLLGATLLNVEPFQLAGIIWPLAVAAIAGGLLFGLTGLPQRREHHPRPKSHTHSRRILLRSIWPIGTVILLSLILPATLPLDERTALILSLLITISLTVILKKIPIRDLGTILRHHIPWATLGVIFGALIFRRVLENSGAVNGVANDLIQLHIPLPLIAFGAPFIAGLLTGLMSAAFSIGFPVILPLIAANGDTLSPGWAAWMMAGGFVGGMLSPVHLCLALTRVYFKAEWGPLYRLLVPPSLLVMATGAILLWLSS